MGKLSAKIKETIAEVRPGITATASRDGRPNVSAKGSLRVVDDEHVAFAGISSPRTIANLQENPCVSILIMHPKSMRSCRIWGEGEILDSGDLLDETGREFAGHNIAVSHVVAVTVEEAQESF